MKGVAIYYLLDPISGDIRYVGKSKDPRIRLRRHCNINDGGSSGTHSKRWIRNLAKRNLKPILRIICWAQDDQEAWRYEIALIAVLRKRGVNLTNESNGGDGRGMSFSHSTETKLKIRETMRLRSLNPATRANVSEAERKEISMKISEGIQKAYADGSVQEKQRASLRALWADPTSRFRNRAKRRKSL